MDSRQPNPSLPACRVDDLIALLLEGTHPLLDCRRLSPARALGKARNFEQVVKLRVGELDQQVSKKFAPGFADVRMVERAGVRAREIADALLWIGPNLCA